MTTIKLVLEVLMAVFYVYAGVNHIHDSRHAAGSGHTSSVKEFDTRYRMRYRGTLTPRWFGTAASTIV